MVMEISNSVLGYLRVAMWATAAFLLSLPALAMQFFPAAGVDWNATDFVIMGVMLLVACSLVELGLRLARNNLSYVAGAIVAVGTGFVTVWANLAVGMILSERNPENFVFLGVIAIALAGGMRTRFSARGLSRSTLAAGMVQGLIGLVVAVAGLDNLYTATLIGAFALPWLLAAGLFHWAAQDARIQA
jgi:hypothetical protein